MALGAGVPLILTYLCFVGTTAVVLSCLVVRRKKGKWCELYWEFSITLTHKRTNTLQKDVASKRINRGRMISNAQKSMTVFDNLIMF